MDFGGYLAAESVISFASVWVMTTGASDLGFMNVYWLGSHSSEQMEKHGTQFWMVRFIEAEYIERAQKWMGRWDQCALLVNRFLAGTRSVIFRLPPAELNQHYTYGFKFIHKFGVVEWNFAWIRLDRAQ